MSSANRRHRSRDEKDRARSASPPHPKNKMECARQAGTCPPYYYIHVPSIIQPYPVQCADTHCSCDAGESLTSTVVEAAAAAAEEAEAEAAPAESATQQQQQQQQQQHSSSSRRRRNLHLPQEATSHVASATEPSAVPEPSLVQWYVEGVLEYVRNTRVFHV